MDPIADIPKKTARQRMEELAPEYLAELMSEFMTKSDLVERQKIRRRIRAMLDLFSADTKWPQGRPEVPRRDPGIGLAGQGAYLRPAPAYDVGPQGRGAAPDDFAEPPAIQDALPAPGAGLADLPPMP